jgi:3-deoxy-manno-octulosonate cytidylyltransferase (CMP-KDO synthetase)
MCQWPPSRLEQEEKLEQLRVLENGHKIKVVFTYYSTLSVDTPQDIIMVENFMKKEQDD